MSLPRLLPAALCLLAVALPLPPGAALPALKIAPSPDGSYTALTSTDGQPLYFAGPGTAAVAVPSAPAAEGTLSFFFTPDWSPGDCTTHWLFELKGEGLLIALRKGYNHAISPDYCYLFLDPEGGLAGFHPENLFRARERHHYAIRWSTTKGRGQLVVDGEAEGRSGKFKLTGGAAALQQAGPATFTLYGMAGGTFDDIRLYGKYLTVPEILQIAGLKEPARYLQSQPPPVPRGASVPLAIASGERDVRPTREYIDPATGQLVRALEDDQAELLPPYNPADYPDLPVTPHTRWARPLAGSKLRILFVATHGFYDEYSMIREAAELWQRLDCDILVTNQPDPRVMSQDFDVIAVSLQGFTNGRWAGWADLDAKLRTWILDRVKTGQSGLVWAYPTAPDDQINALFTPQAKLSSVVLLQGFPAEALHPANSLDGKGAFRWDQVYTLDDSFFLKPGDAEKLVEVYDAGRRDAGPTRRLVKLNYVNASWHPNMGLTPDTALNAAATDTMYDEWMALAARAMLVAAGRTAACRIAKAAPGSQGWQVEITWPRLDLPPLRLWARARDIWGRTLYERTLPVPGAVVTVPTPPLPPRTLLDFILREADGKVADFYSAAVPPATDPKITALTLDREFYAKGQPVKGEIAIAATKPTSCALTVYLTDHDSRRIRQGQCGKLSNGKASFTVTIPASSDSLLMRVEAMLSTGSVVADTRCADVPVPETNPRGFYPLLYGSPFNRLTIRTRHRLFRDQFGVRGGFHQGAHSWAHLVALNLTCIEYSGHLGYPMKQSDCEEFAENWEQNVTRWLMGPPDKMIPYRPLFYSLGEEHFVLLSACPTPTANAKFRMWLKAKYKTLEHLNAVWGAKFATWDEITMMTPEIVDMLKIQFDVVRFENRRFMEHLFADRHAFLADYLRKVTVSGRTGIHAGWDLWMGRGYDYWLLSRAMEDMMCYGGPHNHYARSFFQRYYGSHYHYNIGSHDNVRWHPWYMVLSGAQGLSWYTDAPQIWGATMADLHLTSDWLAAADEFKAAADAGNLLTRLKYNDDQVAIHYSQDSFQVGVSNLTWIHQRFLNLCFDTGTPFRFVSYAQVEQGDLLQRKPKLLVLPHSVALSEAECKGIRDYVAAGGVVWADVMPGTYNNFGQPLESSQLADLFAGLQETKLDAGAALQPAPGAALSSKQLGQGRVILADLGNYSYDRNVGQYLAAANLYDAVAKFAHLAPPAHPLDATTGRLANGIWTATWTNGSALHLAAAKDYQLADRNPASVLMRLDRLGHVYEMRSGKYFGQTREIRATMQPTEGQVFTILPYRVKALVLTPVGKPTRGQDLVLKATLQVEGTVGKDDLNVLQVSVTDPSGREVTALRRTVEMRGGTGQIALPLAFNDAPGKWTVMVRDLATGMKQTGGYAL